MTRRGEPLPINQALNRPRAKLGLDLTAWMAIVFVCVIAHLAVRVNQFSILVRKMSVVRLERKEECPSPEKRLIVPIELRRNSREDGIE